MLASDLAILEVGCNFDRLYEGNDPDYELGLRVVRRRVNAAHRAADQKMRDGRS